MNPTIPTNNVIESRQVSTVTLTITPEVDDRATFEMVKNLHHHLECISYKFNDKEVLDALADCRENLISYVGDRWGYEGIERLWEEP